MTQQTASPTLIDDSRCTRRFANGRRCRRLTTGPDATLCFDHARAAFQAKDDFAPLASLIRKPENFQSAQDLNESLGALHNLLAEGRISPRRAAVIAYVDSLILRTLPAIAQEEETMPIIFDAPRPLRDPFPSTTGVTTNASSSSPSNTNVAGSAASDLVSAGAGRV